MTLEVETSAGTFAPATRASGRSVDDGEIVLAYTPSPLQRTGPQTHLWVAEWQAVPWLGAPALDGLDSRGGLPLGNYRFHVEGEGWTLDSTPFEVVRGGVAVVQPQRVGGMIRATATWYAPKGWRYLDATVPSNRPVPIRSQQVTMALLAGTTVLSTATVTTDASGIAQVANNAAATAVRVTDRFGNVAVTPLP